MNRSNSHSIYCVILAITLGAIFSFPTVISAKTTQYKLDIEKKSKAEAEEQQMAKGSFMVASQCERCNNGYNLSQIEFTGYDKPQSSASETFFITNRTDRTLTGTTLYLEYLDMEGKQLHKKFVKLTCVIPPGETRIANIPSWDKQKRFHYIKSEASKKGGLPFRVVFDPVAFYLRY